jgi:hypothetical protein
LKSLREGKGAAPMQPVTLVPGLTQAEIPAWLEALRPKDEGAAAEAAEEAKEVEKEGPLAGIAQVLPPASIMGDVQGQPARLKIETSPNDLARAGVFQELLSRPVSAPVQVAAPPGRGARVKQRIEQWIVAAVLIAVIWGGAIGLNQLLGFPLLPDVRQLTPPALTQQAVTQIKVLPPRANVLVVFDYDPTQAGEMDQIALAFYQHLLSRGAHIRPYSLNPLGTGVAQSVANRIDARLRASGQIDQPIYVAGQAIGVQQLLLNAGSNNLVIDLAASPDSVRWWVEQIAATRGTTPFIAGVSAAAEPLTLPYVQSGQVQGLVTGAVGAMMYANQAQLPTASDAQPHLQAQILAQWLLVVIIVVAMARALIARVGRRSP